MISTLQKYCCLIYSVASLVLVLVIVKSIYIAVVKLHVCAYMGFISYV